MKLLVNSGEHLGEKLKNFPMAREFLPSEILVVGINDSEVLVACGIRSIFNILTLYVNQGYRGRGLGSLILKKTINVARNRNINFITLAVLSDNAPALHLYHKFGFKKVLYLRNYIAMIFPLTLKGQFACAFSRIIGFVLPNQFLVHFARLIYERTVADN